MLLTLNRVMLNVDNLHMLCEVCNCSACCANISSCDQSVRCGCRQGTRGYPTV